MNKIIEDLKAKGIQTDIRLSEFESIMQFYYQGHFLGKVRSTTNTWTNSYSECMKDLESHYIESEKGWKLDIQLRAFKA